LIGCTALHAEKRELIPSFDTFGNDVKIEGTPHSDNRPHDWGIDLAELKILGERLIDRGSKLARPCGVDPRLGATAETTSGCRL
jgi:hypothetical protein